MLRIPGWLIGVIGVSIFLALFWTPYPYGPIIFILFWFFLAGWGYAYWRDDYAPGGLWFVGASIGIGLTYVWSFIAPYFFNGDLAVLATSSGIMRIVRWVIIVFGIYDLYRDYDRRKNWHRKKKWIDLEDEELPWLYIWNAKCWGNDTNSAEDKTEDIGRDLDMISGLYQEMKRRGIEKKILEGLLTHKNDAVRAMAARHLYWGNQERSMKVFEEVAAENNLMGEDVRGWIKGLREGTIKPDEE